MADNNPNDNSLKIDALIGADSYWNIVADEIIREKSVPIAVESKVGYIFKWPFEEKIK